MRCKEVIQTGMAPKAVGPYSQAVVYGDLLYTAGQIPLDPESGEMVEGGIQEQTRRVLLNLRAVLEAGNSGFDRIIKTTVFLTDLGDFSAMNEIYSELLGESLPARSTVQVAALPKGAKVEIEAVAHCRA